MTPPLRYINTERFGDVTCVSLKKQRLTEQEVLQLSDEVVGLIDGGCHKVVISLGAGALQCLYSVFLAKLVMFQRLLRERGGALKLCDATPDVREVFQACRLDDLFDFAPDRNAAAAAFASSSGSAES
jgi:anti-sigma B factor antagonist